VIEVVELGLPLMIQHPTDNHSPPSQEPFTI
jgi:hypothetical protein